MSFDNPVLKTPWGRLISCLPRLNSVDIVGSTLTLGRSEDCDMVIYKSKFLPKQLLFISKVHFEISKDPQDECVAYIKDFSKNGTYLNNKLIGQNNKIILQNDDCISVGNKLRIFIFKAMNYAVSDKYLIDALKRKYQASKLLGKGACGDVRLAYDKYTCKKYAIKKIIKGKDSASQIYNVNHPSRIQNEIKILITLKHPLVIKTREIIDTSEEVFIVLEYVIGGELSSRLSGNMNESTCKFFFYQMVLAVEYLHYKGVTHRDLKPGNVLLTSLDAQTLLKVTDFGLSNIYNGINMKTVCGTLHYIAPEVLDSSITEYNKQVDVWSLGVMLFYMLSNRLPFTSNDKSMLGKLIVSGKYTIEDPPWYEISANAKDLVQRLLEVNPRQRISVEGILEHPWIKSDNWMRYRVDNMLIRTMQLSEKRTFDFVDKENDVVHGFKRMRIGQ